MLKYFLWLLVCLLVTVLQSEACGVDLPEKTDPEKTGVDLMLHERSNLCSAKCLVVVFPAKGFLLGRAEWI